MDKEDNDNSGNGVSVCVCELGGGGGGGGGGRQPISYLHYFRLEEETNLLSALSLGGGN